MTSRIGDAPVYNDLAPTRHYTQANVLRELFSIKHI